MSVKSINPVFHLNKVTYTRSVILVILWVLSKSMKFYIKSVSPQLLRYPLWKNIHVGKILGKSLALPREYQNRHKQTSDETMLYKQEGWRKKFLIWSLIIIFFLPQKYSASSKKYIKYTSTTIPSCHYQTHSFCNEFIALWGENADQI